MQGSLSRLAGFLQFLRKIAPKRELPFTKVATILVALQMIHGVSVVQSFVKLAAQTRVGTRRNTFPHRLLLHT